MALSAAGITYFGIRKLPWMVRNQEFGKRWELWKCKRWRYQVPLQWFRTEMSPTRTSSGGNRNHNLQREDWVSLWYAHLVIHHNAPSHHTLAHFTYPSAAVHYTGSLNLNSDTLRSETYINRNLVLDWEFKITFWQEDSGKVILYGRWLG